VEEIKGKDEPPQGLAGREGEETLQKGGGGGLEGRREGRRDDFRLNGRKRRRE